jgi:hypothetical protein
LRGRRTPGRPPAGSRPTWLLLAVCVGSALAANAPPSNKTDDRDQEWSPLCRRRDTCLTRHRKSRGRQAISHKNSIREPRRIRRFESFTLRLSGQVLGSCWGGAVCGPIFRSPHRWRGRLRHSTQTPPTNSAQAGAAAIRSSCTRRRML